MEQQQQALLISALTDAANAILITDIAGRIVWVNRAFCALSGYAERELLGQTPGILRSGEQTAHFYQTLWQTILGGQPWQGELIERAKDGHHYSVHQIITPLLDESGTISHFIAIQHDMSEQHAEQLRMQQLAYHDSLTGLPNRRQFLGLLSRAIDNAARQHTALAVMFIDLDGFKNVNDTLGHAIGDALLIAVGERLCGAVRKTDLVARLGGDEFTVLVSHFSDASAVDVVANQLVSVIDEPFALEQHIVQTHASIGISLYPRDSDNVHDLLAKADAAMYRTKARGGHGFMHANAN
ncbi:PAS domain S-box-containing protein/diguanylate cyclase (GGDEF) domain-containing protein [Andreprevotia lacus DSM 23236]|jgi:diguanylate cyclase (GGDEF)-like protein/PAS domain S-box-containing protein|uniref:PAS domain S-box-containing protein/diguanylate cyclase (GGDEF) domain-containing protein n=1 Tax=Andreprevotia lacus DSM 23236 TaxID=1121001 RepID=A0A1W1XS38_9NEIS|nr:GGDEF domain-containing protein [Andreprevotia lacus]SMC26351.1 PAS domain S-box-containing protein/diguanylate cyclase (GGDEF) domain-containing protein [Andreprevotia lacus DSM 23236]